MKFPVKGRAFPIVNTPLMKPHTPLRSLFFLLAAMGCVVMSPAQFRPDFRIKTDDVTVLMGVDAELADGLQRVSHSAHGKFQVSSWTRADQFARWKVSVPAAGSYEVFALVKRAAAQPLVMQLEATGTSLRGEWPANALSWQRVKLDGELALPAGESTLTLRLASSEQKQDFQAELHAIELVKPQVRVDAEKRARAMRANPTWFQQARYGMMVHWTKQSVPLQGEAKPYEQAVADFDVEAFAEQMKSTGAGFVVFTTSHAMHYFPGPLKSLDAILPGRTAKRDLPADLAKALGKRGMKLFLYYHLGAHDDAEYLQASGFWETDTTKFFGHWQSMISEIGERYGDQLAGWWFDDGSTNYYYRSAPWESLAKAAKAGFAQRMVSFNAWELNNPTSFHDYCTGEACYDPRGIDGLLKPEDRGIYPSGTHAGLPASACLIADSNWVHTAANTPPSALRWNAEQLTQLLRGFIEHRNVPIFNLEITQDGKLSPESIATLAEAAKKLK
jgi:hypothetical protein